MRARSSVRIQVIANGRPVLAAQALGADLAYVGSATGSPPSTPPRASGCELG
jgi:hypothetical protein